MLLKAAHKNNLKEQKTFTVRNVNTATIESPAALKSLIRDNFSDDIGPVFDVGYIQGSTVVRIRSKEDLAEMWCDIRKCKNTCLWCDGLIETNKKSKRKRKHVISEDEDSGEDRPKSKKKHQDSNDEKVQEIVDELKTKHGSKYSFMQIRIWAELIFSRLYASLNDPPHNNSMFERAGSGGKASKADRKETENVTKVVTEAASAITSPPNHSPAKLIESRSKLYKQLTELQNLKSIMSEDEYKNEKETIMNLLHQLNPRNT